MISVSPEFMVKIAVEALKITNRRGVVLQGFAQLCPEMLDDEALREYAEKNVCFMKSAPHAWLFPKCACTVIHGGSGTTAASLRSGRPTIITPVFLDQYDFGRAVAKLGVGVTTCQFQKLTANTLAAAIDKCLADEDILKRAAEFGTELSAEDGVTRGVQLVKDFVDGPLRSGEWLKQDKARQKAWLARRNRSMFSCCSGVLDLLTRRK